MTTIAPTTLPCFLCDDDFTGNDGDAPSGLRWIIGAGDPTIQSNTLEMTIGASADQVWNRCILTGDFDVRVYFDVSSSPNVNSWHARLKAYIDDTHQMYVSAAWISYAARFQLGWRVGGGWSYNNDYRYNNTGWLRLVRTGSSIQGMYRDNGGGWTNHSAAQNVGSGDVVIELAMGNWDSAPIPICNFDDFMIVDGCPLTIMPTTTLTTKGPTTLAPTTLEPTTLPPTTLPPTTLPPTTLPPTTPEPTTPGPTTIAPTTPPPTTLAPTTPSPTTIGPTTIGPGPPGSCVWDDDFTDPSLGKWIDSSVYPGVAYSFGSRLALESGNVDGSQGQVTHKAVISGDFDVQVDVELVDYEPNLGFRFGIMFSIDSSHYIVVSMVNVLVLPMWYSGADSGGGLVGNGVHRSHDVGRLRLIRSGSNYSGYYDPNKTGTWLPLPSLPNIGTGDGKLYLESRNMPPAYILVIGSFDNLIFNWGCPTTLLTEAPTTTLTTLSPTTVVAGPGYPDAWVTDNRNSGPWTFVEQPDKWGYLNNPMWQIEPEDPINYTGREDEEPQVWYIKGARHSFSADEETIHWPCGHWHKQRPEGESIYDQICIRYVDENIPLTGGPNIHDGLYDSNDLIVTYSSGTYVIFGDAQGPNLRMLTTVDMATYTETAFDTADVASFHQIILKGSTIYALINRTGYDGRWIQKIAIPSNPGDPFTLVGDPLYAGTVLYGDDGKVYGAKASYNTIWWGVQYMPITGAIWSTAWEQLPDSYPYYIYTYLIYTGLFEYTVGADCVNFNMDSSDRYLINTGPSSGGSLDAIISRLLPTGEVDINFSGSNRIGPNELVVNPNDPDQFCCVYAGTAFGSKKLRIIDSSDDGSDEYNVTGLLDGDGNPLDNAIYHTRTIWWTNGLIYELHSLYPATASRIIAINPANGDVVYQYWIDDSGIVGSFVILHTFVDDTDGYVYVWQTAIHDPGYQSAVIKLTLELEFVCIEQCEGGISFGNYYERGNAMTTDGSIYIYNWWRLFTHRSVTQWTPVAEKYLI